MAGDRLKEARTFFTQGNKTSDAVIRVEDHELQVDLVIISLMSPTLASEFQPRPDPNSPPGETNKAVAKLVGPVDDIVDMLTSIYPNFRDVNVVDEDNVEYLLPLAAKYKLLFLLRTCENVIVDRIPNLNNWYGGSSKVERSNEVYEQENMDRLMRYFVLADKYQSDAVRNQCMDKLVKCSYSAKHKSNLATPTRNTKAFQQLDPTARWEILRNRLFYVEGTYGRVTDNLEDL
ncbi:uncharacterized protein [Haliotis asinina]|uniref:uncharacterized protein n=1 Tax=Haliotis asinina TaxID=109174 RepID=UPI00353182F1